MSVSSQVSRNNYTGNGSVSEYDYNFRIIDEDDLTVTVRNTSDVETTLTKTTDYTVDGVGVGAGGTITLVNAGQAWLTAGKLTTGYVISIRRVLDLVQNTDIRNQGDFYPEAHEDEFDRSRMIDQQQQDELNRSIKLPESVDPADFDATVPASIIGQDGVSIITNSTGDGFIEGPTADEITAAQSYATAASASATASAASAVAASASETAAASSASSAAATLASAFYRDVIYITSASSPVTIAQAQNGYLYVADTSGGAITVNLPSIAGVTLPFNIAFLIKTAGNTLTINRNGTDTIMGATSKAMATANVGVHLVADTGASPDDWSAMDIGAAADLSVTEPKLAQLVFNALTTVTPVAADFVPLADTSDSGNKKKAAVSALRNAVYRAVTTTDNVGVDDETMKLSGASFTATLPTAVGVEGKRYKFIHAGTSLTQVYTLATTSAQTIGGVASGSYKLCTNGEVLEIESDGANWIIINHHAVTDWVDNGAITITATTTSPTKGTATIVVDKSWWRREGRDGIFRYEYNHSAAGTATAGTGDYLFALPSNMTINTSMLSAFTTVEGVGAFQNNNCVGSSDLSSAGASAIGTVSVYNSTNVRLPLIYSANLGFCSAGAINLAGSTVHYCFTFRVPITDWQP